MNYARKRRLMIILFIIGGFSVSVSLLFVALGSNMNHYYEIKSIVSGKAPIGKTIRVGGMVKRGSIKRSDNSLKVSFVVTDFHHSINIKYEGILPDLFREGQVVLAKGKLINSNTFVAKEILAKHDENYMPKEVRDELKARGALKNVDKNKS